jgi:hypothetical protein
MPVHASRVKLSVIYYLLRPMSCMNVVDSCNVSLIPYTYPPKSPGLNGKRVLRYQTCMFVLRAERTQMFGMQGCENAAALWAPISSSLYQLHPRSRNAVER